MKRFTLIDEKIDKVYEIGTIAMNVTFYVCVAIGICIGLLF